MNQYVILWLVVMVATAFLELMTAGLTSIWMTGGALAALIVAGLHGPLWLQIVVFVVVTGALLILTRPIAMRYLDTKKVASNVDEAIGTRVKVLEAVNNADETGKAMYNGVEWTARSKYDAVTFAQGELAIVVAVVGVKLILAKMPEAANRTTEAAGASTEASHGFDGTDGADTTDIAE